MERRAALKILAMATSTRLLAGSAIAPVSSAQVQDETRRFVMAPSGVKGDQAAGFFFNQIGFLPGQYKAATVVHSPNAQEFRVRRLQDDSVMFRGELSAAQEDTASGDHTRVAEFSALTDSGRFRLELEGVYSLSFSVQAGVYAHALRTVMRAFYGQRCGCAVDLGRGYGHAECHLAYKYHVSSGKRGPVQNAGGWHDAGDYGRYVVNSGITCGTLLAAWEMFPRGLRDLDLGIPGTRPGMPDFLAEVLWNLNWMLSLQDDDGGVFHKQTSEHFCAFIMPERDRLPSEIIGTGDTPYKSTAATADFAAVMAIAARCYRSHDPRRADQFLSAAEAAFHWARANPEVVFRNPPGVTTGEYGDRQLADERLWAAAELWRTTQDEAYEEAFTTELRRMYPATGAIQIETPGWGSVGSMACWSYVNASGGDDVLKGAIRDATQRTAAAAVKNRESNGYANTLSLSDYGWGSNSVAANQSLLLIMANSFVHDVSLVDAALDNLHYLLGRNCHGISWVTQIGPRSFKHPHHRPSAADGITEPWPGLLSGGPNSHPADEVASQLPKAPPMRMWVDDQRAYSMNEVAINWNAPLAFLLAFAHERGLAPPQPATI